MFSFLIRIIGIWLMAAAIVAAVVDGTKSIAANSLAITSLGEAWFSFSPQTLSTAQAGIERHVHPVVWDPVIQTVLMQPTWLVLGLAGFVLVALGGGRRSRSIEQRLGWQ